MTNDSTTAAASESHAVKGARSASAGRAPGPSGLANGGGIAGAAGELLLSLRGISKRFGPVTALDHVDLDIPAGQVTALVGDNGAGKSTLIKTISGIWQPDEGELFWSGEPVHVRTPREAADLGIATVYQDLALCDNLDIVQNMFLGRETAHYALLDETSMELSAKDTLSGLSVTSVRSIRQPVGSLSGGTPPRRRSCLPPAASLPWFQICGTTISSRAPHRSFSTRVRQRRRDNPSVSE